MKQHRVWIRQYTWYLTTRKHRKRRTTCSVEAQEAACNMYIRGTPCTSLPLANKYGPLGRCVQCPYISASYNCARGTMLSIEEHLHHAVRNTRHPASRSAHLHHAVRNTCITQCASTCITRNAARGSAQHAYVARGSAQRRLTSHLHLTSPRSRRMKASSVRV
jgi:hypothetical protein